MSGALQRDLLEIALNNQLATPGGLTVLGTPVDLGRVTADTYIVGAETDHLVPWQGAYRSTQLFGGDSTFVLSGGGHIQHLVNPPGNPKAHYRTGQVTGPQPEGWLAGADPAAGHLVDALGRVGAGQVRRASAPHRRPWAASSHPPIEAAPGRYVMEQ